MSTYIMLLTLTPEGRRNMVEDPDALLSAEREIDIPGTGLMGLYAVLGDHDFVGILAAPDNEHAARFSLELGVRAGVQIATLPAIPIGRFEESIASGQAVAEVPMSATPGD